MIVARRRWFPLRVHCSCLLGCLALAVTARSGVACAHNLELVIGTLSDGRQQRVTIKALERGGAAPIITFEPLDAESRRVLRTEASVLIPSF